MFDINKFFNSKLWFSIKDTRLGKEISYDILTRLTRNENILFMGSNRQIDYDPKGVFKNLSYSEKERLYQINDDNTNELYKVGQFWMRHIGSSVVIQENN